MLNTIKIGDKVILSSGGPEMIVESIHPTEATASTCWLDKRYRKRSETFPVAGLTKLYRL